MAKKTKITPEEADKIAEIEKILKGLTDREKLFVENYCRFMSKTRAAIAAGYSEKNASVTGFQVYHKPIVSQAIKEYLTLTRITAEDNVKLIARVAEINTSDYFQYVDTWRMEKKKVPLKVFIDTLKAEIDIEDELLGEATDLTPIEVTDALLKLKQMSRRLKRLEKELQQNPKAFRLDYVDVLVREKVLNMEKIVEDRVPLKSVKYTKEGVQVEFPDARGAQDVLAKINGSFEIDNKQSRAVINNLVGPTAEQLAKLTDEELAVMAKIQTKLTSA